MIDRLFSVTFGHECTSKSRAGTRDYHGADHRLSLALSQEKPRSGCRVGWFCPGVPWRFGSIYEESHLGSILTTSCGESVWALRARPALGDRADSPFVRANRRNYRVQQRRRLARSGQAGLQLENSRRLRLLPAMGTDATDAPAILFIGSLARAFPETVFVSANDGHWNVFRPGSSPGRVDGFGYRRSGSGVELYLLSVSTFAAAGLLSCRTGFGFLLRNFRPRPCRRVAGALALSLSAISSSISVERYTPVFQTGIQGALP